ncbi:glycosyl transferase group 1 [Desulfofundulus kuznetsovii DSM 6115]|uniref:Glycosyl transferase group 1 n=1 Tax=Desulfofundulus kuznetsovii (strain DSM 6115 / VKM B-1805 / 17) TaxID=760568 RepID=A0AAU8PNA4_DESK7|nr:glycosyl transferase group 1 [Desulfofundulus kuznetsovii DSM 6115]
MKILYLITGLAYGGAETQLVRLATALKARNWRVNVVSMLPPQAFTDELQAAGIPLATLNMRRGVPDPRAIVRLLRLIRQSRPHILTSFMFHANLLGRIVGRLAGVPIIVSSIRNENFGGPCRDNVLRLTDWMGEITTTNSRLAADKLVRRGVVPGDRIRVIPNGLVLNEFKVNDSNRAGLRQQLGIAEDEFLWLAVGRLEEQKDYPTLLQAFQILKQGGCKAQLRVAGQGPMLETLQRQIADLGISDRVIFLGLRRDIPLLLDAADGFVLSSAWEGLPNVVMEAMAAAKPVVATNVGGVPELVQEGVTGFMVPPRNAEALSTAMSKMMALPESKRKAMGQSGRAHIEVNYSLERVVDQWEALYMELLGKKGLGKVAEK